MKTCSKCSLTKKLSEFNKRSSAKDGLSSICRVCDKIKGKSYYINNTERVLKRMRDAYIDNPLPKNLKNKKWNLDNKEYVTQYHKEYRKLNKESRLLYNRTWLGNHPECITASAAKRKASKRRASPSWANAIKIRAFYISSEQLGMLTGKWHHVDHIVPLRGKTVCGLHNEFNLQILTAADNIKKSNRYWPDMW